MADSPAYARALNGALHKFILNLYIKEKRGMTANEVYIYCRTSKFPRSYRTIRRVITELQTGNCLTISPVKRNGATIYYFKPGSNSTTFTPPVAEEITTEPFSKVQDELLSTPVARSKYSLVITRYVAQVIAGLPVDNIDEHLAEMHLLLRRYEWAKTEPGLRHPTMRTDYLSPEVIDGYTRIAEQITELLEGE